MRSLRQGGMGWTAAAVAVTAVTLSELAGCGKTMHVELPQDYHGPVVLLCSTGMPGPADVHVPAGGEASGVSCPREETELTVTRGGQRVTPESKPVWQRTGDGVPVSIEFRVK